MFFIVVNSIMFTEFWSYSFGHVDEWMNDWIVELRARLTRWAWADSTQSTARPLQCHGREDSVMWVILDIIQSILINIFCFFVSTFYLPLVNIRQRKTNMFVSFGSWANSTKPFLNLGKFFKISMTNIKCF